jgi:hypothetical protein
LQRARIWPFRIRGTYAVGELFPAELAFGLLLCGRFSAALGVGAAVAASAGGELGAAEWGISAYDGRSCGAGEGATAMAALMMAESSRIGSSN